MNRDPPEGTDEALQNRRAPGMNGAPQTRHPQNDKKGFTSMNPKSLLKPSPSTIVGHTGILRNKSMFYHGTWKLLMPGIRCKGRAVVRPRQQRTALQGKCAEIVTPGAVSLSSTRTVVRGGAMPPVRCEKAAQWARRLLWAADRSDRSFWLRSSRQAGLG